MLKQFFVGFFTAAMLACFAPSSGRADDAKRETDPSKIYTLYRSSPVLLPGDDGDMWRIHVATFDTGDGAAYNQANCLIAARLFAQQPGVTVRYWCEHGPYSGPMHP